MTVLFVSTLAAPAFAQEETVADCGAKSSYDFGDLAVRVSDNARAFCGKDFDIGSGFTANAWGQIGDEKSIEFDFLVFTPRGEVGPLSFGAGGGFYYAPGYKKPWTTTVMADVSMDIGSGWSVGAEYQWYGENMGGEQRRSLVAAGPVFDLFDLSVGYSLVEDSGSEHPFGTISKTFEVFDKPLTFSLDAFGGDDPQFSFGVGTTF